MQIYNTPAYCLILNLNKTEHRIGIPYTDVEGYCYTPWIVMQPSGVLCQFAKEPRITTEGWFAPGEDRGIPLADFDQDIPNWKDLKLQVDLRGQPPQIYFIIKPNTITVTTPAPFIYTDNPQEGWYYCTQKLGYVKIVADELTSTNIKISALAGHGLLFRTEEQAREYAQTVCSAVRIKN